MPNLEVVLSGLELLSDWIQPSNTGDTGGGSSKPNGTFTLQPGTAFKPAVDAILPTPAIFSAAGNYAYNNGYWYRALPGAWDAMTYFLYELEFMLPTAADLAACQAIEFEVQQNVGGYIYNMAWQADIKGSGVWRVFDYNTSSWTPTAIPASIVPGQWVAVEAEFLRGVNNTLTHLAITLNGVRHLVNITKAATAKVQSDYVHCAFQLDSLSAPVPYTCKVSGVNVTMLPTGV